MQHMKMMLAKLQLFFVSERLSKVPIYYRDKLNTLLKELEKHIMKQIGSSPQD